MEILLTIALFVAFFLLLRQEKALAKYAQSTALFELAVDQYQEAVEGYQEAITEYQQAVEGYQETITEHQETVEFLRQEIAEYESLLKAQGIEKSKPELTKQLIPPPPPELNLHRQPKILERDRR